MIDLLYLYFIYVSTLTSNYHSASRRCVHRYHVGIPLTLAAELLKVAVQFVYMRGHDVHDVRGHALFLIPLCYRGKVGYPLLCLHAEVHVVQILLFATVFLQYHLSFNDIAIWYQLPMQLCNSSKTFIAEVCIHVSTC